MPGQSYKGVLILLFLTSYSYAETWKTEYKYYSNEYVKAIVKDIASQNRDKKKKTVYYIDSAMLNSACLIAKKNAHGFFESMNYASLYPNAKFRVVFGECENDEPAGQKDEFWEVKVSVPTEFQRAELEKTHDDNGELIIPISKDKRLTPEEICKKKPPLSGSQSGVRSISGERYIYVEGCEYIATGDVLICFENSDICNATAWIPTGEVAEGKGYGKTNNNAETALVHSFCESQYGTYGDIITSDDYVVTDRCKPVFKENKFLGWSGSGAYSDMNNPPYFPDTGIFRVVPDPEYSSSGFSSGTSKHKVEYNLNYLTLHPDLDLARYPLPVYSDLPLSSPSGSDSINLGSTTHSVDAGSRIAGSSANTESATHSLSSSGTSQSGVSSSSGAASNFGQSSGSAGNGQGSDL